MVIGSFEPGIRVSGIVDSIRIRTTASERFVTLWAPSGPLREADEIAPGQLVFAFRIAQRGGPHQDEQPLLFGVLVVIRADALAGVELVDRRAELLGADTRAEPRRPDAITRRILGVILDDSVAEVERLAESRPRHPPQD
jgi:hypothetical protein